MGFFNVEGDFDLSYHQRRYKNRLSRNFPDTEFQQIILSRLKSKNTLKYFLFSFCIATVTPGIGKQPM